MTEVLLSAICVLRDYYDRFEEIVALFGMFSSVCLGTFLAFISNGVVLR